MLKDIKKNVRYLAISRFFFNFAAKIGGKYGFF